MKRYRVYATRLQNNNAYEPSQLGIVYALSKKKAVQVAYREFDHLLSMYQVKSLFAVLA